MTQRVIPLIDQRQSASSMIATSSAPWSPGTPLLDLYDRPLTDLRISVTDRCNFRCSYCMPKEVFDKDYSYLPQSALLSFEEITRVASVFAQLGVSKLRLTGGEPLLRKNIESLIESLATLRTPSGQALEMALTTNGSLLARKALSLKSAGLQRVTVSLDALDDAIFRQMNDVDFPVAQVLEGIEAALAAGLRPLKVNVVVKRGTNESQILPMARYFRENYGAAVVLRFIEYMDVGATNGWRMDEVVPSAEVVALINSAFPLRPLEAHTASETAQRWAYEDGRGEIGVISSVTRAFCHDCSRARLSTEGQLFLCLFGHRGHDLKHLLRAGASDETLMSAVAQIWRGRGDRYSQLRAQNVASPSTTAPPARRVEMSYIGG